MLGDLIYYADKKRIESPLSAYQPSEEIKQITQMVKLAYEDGQNVLNTPYKEFNNRSVLQRADEDQMAWLSWTPDPYEGEDDWRWNGVRPITRNRVISVAAHLTSQLLIPNVFAQNEFDEEDREAAYVMKDMIEFNIKRSNYDTSFLFGVIAGLVNPVSYFKVDYVKAYQDIWNEGKLEQVLDDTFSGFQNSLIPIEEIYIENPYQYELQKQDWIIHKKHISYGEAEAKYGKYPQFQYVEAGKKVILHEDSNFYQVEDVNDTMVEEVCFKNRRKDTEIYFLGGVYMGNDNVDFNPFIHRTNKNKPKYNITKFGYEPIDPMRFFFYKSLVAKMSNDQEAADREWQMYFDASFLSTFPPTITMGAGKIDRSVIAPATNTEIGKDAKISPLNIANPGAALGALREAERSLTESSQDPQMSGDQQGPEKTARESILLQQNATTNLGIASKMIGTMVKEIGGLYVDNIIRYQSVGELSEITGELTYKTFVVDGKVKGGKDKSSYIKFTDRFAGKEMSKEEKDKENYKLADEAGEEKDIYEVNPYVFSRMDYMITIDADRALQKNDAFERAFKLETYDRAIANPLVMQDPESMQKITRDFLFEPLMRGEASKYLPNVEKVAQSLVPNEQNGGARGKGLPERMVQGSAMRELPV